MRNTKRLMLSVFIAVLFIFPVRVSAAAQASTTDCAWSWWTYPLMSISPKNGNVYFSYNTKNRGQGIGIFNPRTGHVSKNIITSRAVTDDHNAPAVYVLKDGRILTAYATGHGSDPYLHIRVSERAGNIFRWNKEKKLRSRGKTTYAQIFSYGGKYFIFYRSKVSSTEWRWCCRTSVDLAGWSGEKTVVRADQQYYCLFRPTTSSGKLRVVMTANPAQSAVDFREGFIDLGSEKIYNADNKTELGSLSGGPISYKKYNVILKKTVGKSQRLFDVAITAPSSIQIAYCTFDRMQTPSQASYRIYANGKTTEIARSGKSFWRSYFGGISFVKPGIVVASFAQNGRDHIARMTIRNGRVISSKNISTTKNGSNYRSIRPVCDPSGRAVMWQYGYYNPNTYKDYSLTARFLMVG